MHVNIVKLYYFYIILYLYFPLFQICNFLFSNVLFYFSLNCFSFPLSYILYFLGLSVVQTFWQCFPFLQKVFLLLLITYTKFSQTQHKLLYKWTILKCLSWSFSFVATLWGFSRYRPTALCRHTTLPSSHKPFFHDGISWWNLPLCSLANFSQVLRERVQMRIGKV